MESFSEPIDKSKAKMMNPLVLAFVGDSVQTLYVRARLAVASDEKAHALHAKAASVICAKSQSEQVAKVQDMLTEEELEIFHRARNSKSAHHAKNFAVTDYRRASGLEAVIGYLYLTGSAARLNELFAAMEGTK